MKRIRIKNSRGAVIHLTVSQKKPTGAIVSRVVTIPKGVEMFEGNLEDLDLVRSALETPLGNACTEDGSLVVMESDDDGNFSANLSGSAKLIAENAKLKAENEALKAELEGGVSAKSPTKQTKPAKPKGAAK